MLLLLLNLPPFVDWHETERDGWRGWLTHALRATLAAVVVGAKSDSSYRSRMVPAYLAWRAIDSRTPVTSRILTFVGGDHLYSNRARLWSDAAMSLPVTWSAFAGDEDASLAAASRLVITYILFDKRQFADRDFAELAVAVRECCLVPFHEDDRIVVYGLNTEGVTRTKRIGQPTTDVR